MVSALIQLDKDTNRAISVIKARHGLKDKGEAITFIVEKYFQEQEPELLPEFVEKLKLIEKEPYHVVEDFAERFIHSHKFGPNGENLGKRKQEKAVNNRQKS